MPNVSVSYLFSGMSDYFGGHGCEANQALLYSFYGKGTTLADIVDELVEDSWNGAAGEDIPEELTDSDVREALMRDMLNDVGRADVASGAIAECALDYSSANDLDECRECHALCGESHEDDCGMVADWREVGEWDEDEAPQVEDADCIEDDDDFCCGESPVFIVLLEWEVCADCGKWADLDDDDICVDCGGKDADGWFANDYKCPCGASWSDEHGCMCNDRCPDCNKEIEPIRSEDISHDGAPCPYDPGETVYWDDPDNGTCSRTIVIASIAIVGETIRITGTDGSALECPAVELSYPAGRPG
jgi:hypothetical protein